MYKTKKEKILMIIALIFGIVSLSVGFAAFSVSLNISSQASITPNSDTFSVKFSTNKDSLVVGAVTPSSKTSGITTSDGIIDNSTNPTIKGLSATFTQPGQYVEYTFYARNEGEYTAYLNSINYFGKKTCEAGDDATASLVESACNYINMSTYVEGVEYSDTTQITGHSLAKDMGEEIKIRVSYDAYGTSVDGAFSISFGDLIMVYSTIDDSTYIPSDSPLNYRLLSDVVKENAISDISIDFASTSGLATENNIAYVMNDTVNDTNPIYYYRGNVTKNNVRFANFCWKIVRTTETGGIKLIYNGVPAEDGSCNNTGEASQIETKNINAWNSPAFVGYMYGKGYYAAGKDLSSQTDVYVYGNDVAWDGKSYTLTDTMTSSSLSADSTTLATKYHYTCFNDTGICAKVYYINGFDSANGKAHHLTLSGGKNIDDVKDEMFTNTTDSTIKTTIDTWYASNMTSYTEQLEDTVWCNDRTLTSGALHSKDSNATDSLFGANERNFITFKPSIACSNIRDSFTVYNTNGNGRLTYPVGLLTADEITLAGSGNAGYSKLSYLYTGQNQWSLSPYYFGWSTAREISLSASGNLYYASVSNPYSVRPSVSLKLGTYVSSGDGSVTNPYIVE